MFSVNFPENASKQQKLLVKLFAAHFEEKNNIFFNFSHFTGLIINVWLNKLIFSSGFAPFQTR